MTQIYAPTWGSYSVPVHKLFEFAERGYEVWGVDVEEDAIRLCKELLPQGHFFQGELQETSLPDGHFDYIRIDNALEHVPNPKEVIRECRRLLIYEYNPTSWLPLSIMQWRNQKQPAMNLNHARWLTLDCYPIGWLAAKFGMGEELVGTGRL